MNRLTDEKQAATLSLLLESKSIRNISRVLQVSINPGAVTLEIVCVENG